MSDDMLTSIGTHAASGAGVGALVALVSRWFSSREAHDAASEAAAVKVQLALLNQSVQTLTVSIEKHGNLGERVALLEGSSKRLHERLDSLEKSPKAAGRHR